MLVKRALIAGIIALIPSLTASAQASATPSTAAQIAPPVLPFIVSYRYWPVQFVQWVDGELPYSMVVLSVDSTNSKRPVLDFTLFNRSTGARVHYTNDDAVLAAVQASSEEVHKTAMAFEPADNDNNGSVTSVRFTMADGKPLQFRFVQGSDMSQQGSGLNPFPGTKIPIFAYRELGAIAGEGTALQIGDAASPAAVWTEISQPPYFVAYHGAETESAHTLVFGPGKQDWKIVSAPASLATGAAWQLEGSKGDHRTIHIDKADGAHITATCTDSAQPGTESIVEAVRSGDSWSINSVRFQPLRDGEKHALTLEFSTPLSLESGNTKFSLLAGHKSTFATGAVATSATASDRIRTVTFTDPKWLEGIAMQEQSGVTDAGIAISAHP